jgi:hypothetical protein
MRECGDVMEEGHERGVAEGREGGKGRVEETAELRRFCGEVGCCGMLVGEDVTSGFPPYYFLSQSVVLCFLF